MQTYNFNIDWNKKYTCEAMINGKIVEYDMTNTGSLREPKTFLTDYVLWVYIGAGVIYRINGVLQNSNEARHFWKRIDLASLGAVVGK